MRREQDPTFTLLCSRSSGAQRSGEAALWTSCHVGLPFPLLLRLPTKSPPEAEVPGSATKGCTFLLVRLPGRSCPALPILLHRTALDTAHNMASHAARTSATTNTDDAQERFQTWDLSVGCNLLQGPLRLIDTFKQTIKPAINGVPRSGEGTAGACGREGPWTCLIARTLLVSECLVPSHRPCRFSGISSFYCTRICEYG